MKICIYGAGASADISGFSLRAQAPMSASSRAARTLPQCASAA